MGEKRPGPQDASEHTEPCLPPVSTSDVQTAAPGGFPTRSSHWVALLFPRGTKVSHTPRWEAEQRVAVSSQKVLKPLLCHPKKVI